MPNSTLPKDWDERLIDQNGHFLQSSHWAAFQQSVGNQVVFDAGPGWSYLASVRNVRRLKYLFVQCGPTIAEPKNLTQALQSLYTKADELGCTFVRIEPLGDVSEQDLMELGAREVAPVEPKYPWVLDISPSEEVLRSGLSAGHRYGVNSASRKGLRFAESKKDSDVELFLKMMHDTTKGRFSAHEDDYYRTMLKVLGKRDAAKLFIAKHEGEPIASALVFDWNKTRYYAHAGAFQAQNRKLSAAMPLVWHMILDAKAQGFTRFDFWGVTPSDDPAHPWAGFTKFKKAFGGKMLTRVGTWEVPVRQSSYRLYKLAKRIRRV